jgi:hypothetical protein
MIEVLAWISPMALTMCVIFGLVLREKQKEVETWKRRYDQAMRETDFDRLCRKYDVQRVRNVVKVTESELGRTADPAARLVEARQQSIQGVVETLIDEGYFQLTRQDRPSSPTQEWEAALHVIDPRAEEDTFGTGIVRDLSSSDLLKPRNESEGAA